MMRELPESHPLHRLFRGLTEHTFLTELGIGDPGLVGYVAGLLARFVPEEGVWRLRDSEGETPGRGRRDGRRGRIGRRGGPSQANATGTSATSPSSGPASIPRPSASCVRATRPIT